MNLKYLKLAFPSFFDLIDFQTNPNEEILQLVSSGLEYLETRTEFWRQQKPIYARRKEAATISSKMEHARERQLKRKSVQVVRKTQKTTESLDPPMNSVKSKTHQSPTHIKTMTAKSTPKKADDKSSTEKKKTAISAEDKQVDVNLTPTRRSRQNPASASASASKNESTKKSLCALADANESARDVLEAIGSSVKAETHSHTITLGEHYLDMFAGSSAPETVCHVLIVMGAAHFYLAHESEAETVLKQALGNKGIAAAQQSNALGLLGRVYAKTQRFDDAADTWRRKLAVDDTLGNVEKAWLFHDIARCYIELHRTQDANDMAETAFQHAKEANEPRWLLNTCLLQAQLCGSYTNGSSLTCYRLFMFRPSVFFGFMFLFISYC